MAQSAVSAWLFLPFVLPLCLYIAFTDLAQMRITNPAVIVLALIFVLLGWMVLPLDAYLWRLAALPVVLVLGIALNAAGIMGAGDAKFLAAAAPYLALPDWRIMMAIYVTTLLSAYAAHRLAKFTPLRRLAPHWDSWDQGRKFPMGLALGPALALYLALGAVYGS